MNIVPFLRRPYLILFWSVYRASSSPPQNFFLSRLSHTTSLLPLPQPTLIATPIYFYTLTITLLATQVRFFHFRSMSLEMQPHPLKPRMISIKFKTTEFMFRIRKSQQMGLTAKLSVHKMQLTKGYFQSTRRVYEMWHPESF